MTRAHLISLLGLLPATAAIGQTSNEVTRRDSALIEQAAIAYFTAGDSAALLGPAQIICASGRHLHPPTPAVDRIFSPHSADSHPLMLYGSECPAVPPGHPIPRNRATISVEWWATQLTDQVRLIVHLHVALPGAEPQHDGRAEVEVIPDRRWVPYNLVAKRTDVGWAIIAATLGERF